MPPADTIAEITTNIAALQLEPNTARRNIVVLQAKLGQVVGQSPSGLLLRSKVAKNSTIS